MTTNSDDATNPHEMIAGMIDAGDDFLDDAGAPPLDDAPHPALGGYPYGGQGDDEVVPADDERPEDDPEQPPP